MENINFNRARLIELLSAKELVTENLWNTYFDYIDKILEKLPTDLYAHFDYKSYILTKSSTIISIERGLTELKRYHCKIILKSIKASVPYLQELLTDLKETIEAYEEEEFEIEFATIFN